MKANNTEWQAHLQDTVLRESVLNWYEFRPDSSLLEIGYSCRAVTELFCRRVKSVCLLVRNDEEKKEALPLRESRDNLCILSSPEEAEGEGFDYVVCLSADLETDPVKAMQQWKQRLLPGGILLLGAENRYGLRYFCGAGEHTTGLPYLGINGYPAEWKYDKDPAGRTYSRQEWSRMIELAGIPKARFYYPVPDKIMPQMIFSDEYQNSANAMERLNDYHYVDPSMIGIEHRIFRDVIDGGALPFMANSFLVEMTLDGTLSDIDYAVVTTDRGPEFGMATTIRNNKRVHKRPLWREGEAQIAKLLDYTRMLEEKGVPVVPQQLQKDKAGVYLDMPFVENESLIPVLEKAAEKDRELFFAIFDALYDRIIKSAVLAENGRGQVFLDLAPCNCFYIESKENVADRLLFYDQEFVSSDGSPASAMYRTIKYFFASSKKARETLPVEEVYRRYGITPERAAEYEDEEQRFIRSVRRTDKNQWLIKASTPDYPAMQKRAERLIPPEKKPYHVGYVPGVFDLFHTGHLRLIERCKERCDYLIVGVLTDELVEYYKGRPPVVSCEDRMNVIRGLRAVDRVVPVDFGNTDKLDAWEQLHYDCHFSGDDHVNHWNDVWEELKKRGSNMEFFSYTQGISSTSIKEKMR